eukprot:Unigene4551_Nuclearia_a/m.13901 Unigene4551_Nuclearia_a/g.13901  ORF Unigene4551_Nuclearia_a/g.13901 Unigene4551_Nuclearia_a/m.13901 type:complete len:574 (-) Unigene4551_Nuclearia_a:82-1803(-)
MAQDGKSIAIPGPADSGAAAVSASIRKQELVFTEAEVEVIRFLEARINELERRLEDPEESDEHKQEYRSMRLKRQREMDELQAQMNLNKRTKEGKPKKEEEARRKEAEEAEEARKEVVVPVEGEAYIPLPMDILQPSFNLQDLLVQPITSPLYVSRAAVALLRRDVSELPDWLKMHPTNLHFKINVHLEYWLLHKSDTITTEDSMHSQSSLIFALLTSLVPGLSFDRNVITTTTTGKTRPDISGGFSQYPPLILAEEKAISGTLMQALDDLRRKFFRLPHYGQLPFVFGFAFQGSNLVIYQMIATNSIQPFSENSFVLTDGTDILRLIAALINIGRYCRSVIAPARLNPIMYPIQLKMLHWHKRTNCEVRINFDNVEKAFSSPLMEMKAWRDAMTAFYDTGKDIPFTEKSIKQEERLIRKGDNEKSLVFTLQPVGIERVPTLGELPRAIYCIGSALSMLHKRGWTHNDVRWPNIVYTPDSNSWHLIDCEYANRVEFPPVRYPAEVQPERCTTERDVLAFAKLISGRLSTFADTSSDTEQQLRQAVAGLSDGSMSIDDVLKLPCIQHASRSLAG